MPDGRTLPCHGAVQITTLRFDSVRDRSLRWIWEESTAFQAFRGDEWMQEPCRSCPRKTIDFGGCRCQAFALTGDAAATDPVCTLTPGALDYRRSDAAGVFGSPRTSTAISRLNRRVHRVSDRGGAVTRWPSRTEAVRRRRSRD